MPAMAVDYYDRMSDGVANFYLGPVAEDIKRTFNNGAHILDIGTGTGHLPILLAQGNPNHQVTGLDLSRSFIQRAQVNADKAGVSQRVKFINGNISEVRDKFDLIVSTCSLHHWRHPTAMLKGMTHLLTEAGQIWLLDDFGDASEDARKDWVRKVEASFNAGSLFRLVFNFESKHLAYNESEFRSLCEQAGLLLSEFRTRDVFFLAKCELTTK